MMVWKEIRIPRVEESYFRGTLDNGLTVYVYPMPWKNGVFALLSAKVGSVTGDFTLDGRTVSVPAGVAHFLEHKLFEGPDGDAFSLFAKTGASANAYTSFERTAYLFLASINIEESLRTLIRFVSNPLFTAENVAKEQGIIAQEIKMYDDNPDWVLSKLLLENLYHEHPIREDIAGTVESIAQIGAELLYDCYNAFYRPSNMVLSIAGNIELDTVERVCSAEYAAIAAKTETVARLPLAEPDDTVRGYAERSMDIFEQQFALGFKERPYDESVRFRKEMCLRMLLEMMAGETSSLYRRLYDDGLVNGLFDASMLSGEGYLCTAFTGESEHPETVIAEIRKEIAAVRENGLDPALFLECKRSYIGAELCALDSPESAASKMMIEYFKNIKVYDIIEVVENITLEEIYEVLRECLRDEFSSIALLKPIPSGE